MVTTAQIKKFCPTAKVALVTAIVANWSTAVAAGIATDLRISHFMAQIATETGGLRAVEESLTYTSAARLMAVWPSRFKSAAAAQPYVRQPQKLAIKVYGGRLGNAKAPSTDGWDFRGGAMMQTTGRENYRKMGFENNPEALRDPTTAFLTAVREWSNRGCNALADKDDVVAIRRAINGGTNGLAETRTYLAKAKTIFSGVKALPTKKPAVAAKPEANSVDLIKKVQQLLFDKGYPEVGDIDGKMGERTADAITIFQRRNALPITGKVTDELLVALLKAPQRENASSRTATTAVDIKEDESVKLGARLKKLGYGLLATFGLGGIADGTASLDKLTDSVTSLKGLGSALGTVTPWLIGIGVGGVAIYFGSRIIREQVIAFRDGRLFTATINK